MGVGSFGGLADIALSSLLPGAAAAAAARGEARTWRGEAAAAAERAGRRLLDRLLVGKGGL